MTIDPKTETLISFSELAASLPSRRQNRPVHIATIHRWRSPGLKGFRLDAIRVGGAWCTTWEAFSRFCGQLTAHETGGAEVRFTSSTMRAKHRADESRLTKDGW